MLAKRIIPCLDVKEGKVVKGIQFQNHRIMGDILDYAAYYQESGADEIVFYDITASSDGRVTDADWVTQIARLIDVPFCVAGGIRTLDDAKRILNAGADKVSINSPAIENPEFINELSVTFGSQCIVVGIDSLAINDDYFVYQYTGNPDKTRATLLKTMDWASEVQQLGAGEIVLNCMNQDGVREGYDLKQLDMIRNILHIPLIASGGAGSMADFVNVFKSARVDGALAASVFHQRKINIIDLKKYLRNHNIEVRV